MDPRHLESSSDPGGDESCRYQILGDGGIEIESSACYGQRWGHDGPDHSQCVLETKENGKKDRDLVVEAVERSLIVLIFAI
jgi:hypothetical protein